MADEDLKGVSEINNTENEGLDSGAAGGQALRLPVRLMP